jgi:hypothetical protein
MTIYIHVEKDVVVNVVNWEDTVPPEMDGNTYIIPDPGGLSIGDNYLVGPYLNLKDRNRAKTKLGLSDGEGKILRAIVAVLLDEINILRTNAGLGQRTLNQAKNAIFTKLDSGNVDA